MANMKEFNTYVEKIHEQIQLFVPTDILQLVVGIVGIVAVIDGSYFQNIFGNSQFVKI